MSSPTYYSDFPNIDYLIEADAAGNKTTIKIKDLFHRMKVRDDIFVESSLYTTYRIQNGTRPEQVSYEVYGDERYYWLVLMVNDISDYYNQWPLSSTEFDEFIIRKYGSYDQAGQVRHYETIETYDIDGNLVLPAGIIVGKDFRYEYRFTREDDDTTFSEPRAVTYLEYEYELNEKKADISLIKKEYVPDVVRDIRNYARKLKPVSSELSISEVN